MQNQALSNKLSETQNPTITDHSNITKRNAVGRVKNRNGDLVAYAMSKAEKLPKFFEKYMGKIRKTHGTLLMRPRMSHNY